MVILLHDNHSAPYRKVVAVQLRSNGQRREELECGHSRPKTRKKAKRRLCWQCAVEEATTVP